MKVTHNTITAFILATPTDGHWLGDTPHAPVPALGDIVHIVRRRDADRPGERPTYEARLPRPIAPGWEPICVGPLGAKGEIVLTADGHGIVASVSADGCTAEVVLLDDRVNLHCERG